MVLLQEIAAINKRKPDFIFALTYQIFSKFEMMKWWSYKKIFVTGAWFRYIFCILPLWTIKTSTAKRADIYLPENFVTIVAKKSMVIKTKI